MASPTVTIEVGYSGRSTPVHTLVLPANPDEHLTIDLRNTLIQTRIGAYYDQWGRGIPTLVLSGTTAWQSAQGAFDGRYCSGQEAALHLQRDIFGWYERHQQTDQTPTGVTMTIVDEATRNVWTVTPITELQWSQTQTAPTLAYFTWNLSVLQDHMTGAAQPPPYDALARAVGDPTTRDRAAHRALQQSSQSAQAQRQDATQIRTILAGETFWSIAQSVVGANAPRAQVQAEVTAITQANPALNPNTLPVGVSVVVPIPLAPAS